MPPRTRSEALEVIRQLATRDQEIRQEDNGLTTYIENAERFIKCIWVCASLIVAVSVWTAKVQWDSAKHSEDITKLMQHYEKVNDIRITDQALLQSIQNTIKSNYDEQIADMKILRDDVTVLKLDSPKTAEMWFMMKHGITNKESYLQENTRPSSPDR